MSMIALTVGSPGLDVGIEPRFGRAALILLVDSDTLAWEPVANPARDVGGGAGVQVAQLLSDHRVSGVISGHYGPKANEALAAAGIAMHCCKPGTTVRQAMELMKQGELPAIEGSHRRNPSSGEEGSPRREGFSRGESPSRLGRRRRGRW